MAELKADPGSSSRILRKVGAESRHLFLKLQRLQQIGVAISAEQSLDKLLGFILTSARELSGADAGSVFVRVDEVTVRPGATGKDDLYASTPFLVLKAAQNASIGFPFQEMKLPFDSRSIVGYAARNGSTLNIPDAYAIPANAGYAHATRFDEATGYRSKSVLVVPMRDIAGQTVGVLQLINKKDSPSAVLASAEDVARRVQKFDEVDEELISALASQAGVSIEKANLYQQIRAMFRGFVASLIGVLERRNYTTFGHCKRIADYALALARCVNSHPNGAMPDASFGPADLEELEYGALLHDIGKLAVGDAILDKRNKLTDTQIRIIEYRFAHARASGKLDADVAAKWLAQVRKCNVPSQYMSDEDAAGLGEIRKVRIIDIDGRETPLLTDAEFENLSIRYGNLTATERRAIEQHVSETWEILKGIPWARHLRRVPNIAGTHHERLDGSGYPWKLKAGEIPLGGKILGITDIFEALTAQDRPYKPAMTADEAIAIIERQVQSGKLDRTLFDLFVKHRLFSVHIGEDGRIRVPRPSGA